MIQTTKINGLANTFTPKAVTVSAPNVRNIFLQKVNTFGKRSRKELATAHPDLQKLFNEVIKHFDCSVICGHRGREDQDKAFAEGKSKLKWPNSKHNKTPSLAVDVVPFPIDWENENEFHKLAGVVDAVALQMNIKVKWGGSWKKFKDLPHWELA